MRHLIHPFEGTRYFSFVLCCASCFSVFVVEAQAQLSFEDEPINYESAPVNDPIARIQAKLDAGELELMHDPAHGYLPALMEALDMDIASQMLVFSKTSFQLRRIDPNHPRALYFRDDVYLGWVQGGDVVEVVSVDPNLGPVFYTLSQESTERPSFLRDQGQCLTCHASSRTHGVPGPLVRSVYVDGEGQPLPGTRSFSITHESPLKTRWGGWYVTGTHGDDRHLGNEFVTNKREREAIDIESGANVTDLSSRIDMRPYLSPYSDIVALMVLEHQCEIQNLITRAGYEARSAIWYDSVMNEALERPQDYISDSTKRRIDDAANELVRYLLFCGEAKLESPIVGTTPFATSFAARGPHDARGRSLRDFDLTERLFKYPCSYMIYSPAFDALPDVVKDVIYARLWDVLSGKVEGEEFAHLTRSRRNVILAILRETKQGLPESWSQED